MLLDAPYLERFVSHPQGELKVNNLILSYFFASANIWILDEAQ